MRLTSTGARLHRSGANPAEAGPAPPPRAPGLSRRRAAADRAFGPATSHAWTFQDALFLGQAPDGGLFVPEELAPLPRDQLRAMAGKSFAERSLVVARHLLADEVAENVLRQVVHDALDFPVPLRPLEPGVHVLELFHGPTCAFKDVGARFMARMMSALRPDADAPLTVLAATSGDTGGAVAHAFHGLPGARVVVLYPQGRVSPRQEAQFATLGGNVAAVAVRGAFDDCQRLAREAFADRTLCAAHGLTSANSINVGRLLPQVFYYVHGWAELATGEAMADRELVVSVPSGNFGNLTAGVVARALGVPISRFVAATNANSVVPDYLATGGFRPRPSVATLSNAMDVGDPSNFRRIRHAFGGNLHAIRTVLAGSAWTDDQTRECIRELWRDQEVALDPHTAVGLLGLRQELARREAARRDGVPPDPPGASPRRRSNSLGAAGIVLGTAHPAKFAEVVEPLTGEPVPVPAGLARAMELPRRSVVVEPKLGALIEVLESSGP